MTSLSEVPTASICSNAAFNDCGNSGCDEDHENNAEDENSLNNDYSTENKLMFFHLKTSKVLLLS